VLLSPTADLSTVNNVGLPPLIAGRVPENPKKQALLETPVEHDETSEQTSISQQEYVLTRVQAIHRRLQETTALLRE
jgi:hypothetical protein